MYIVYDGKSESYTLPMFHLAVGDAIRNFTQAANSKESMIGLYPEDFSLFECGEYDEQTGKFSLYKAIKHVANAIDLVQSSEPVPLESPQAAA